MDQIVFYWMGEKIDIPRFLVDSIKLSQKGNIKIIQISDEETEKIMGVDKIIRINVSKKTGRPVKWVTDRLTGYSLVETKENNTLFLDADSLVIKNLKLNQFSSGIYLSKRKKNNLINYKSPLFYPEFYKKTLMEVMPFLFYAILINKSENIFNNLLNLLYDLPERFHIWYGDQYCLKKFYDKNKINFKFFEDDFAYVVELSDKSKNTNINLNIKNQLITFKGSTKKHMEPVFNWLKSKQIL